MDAALYFSASLLILNLTRTCRRCGLNTGQCALISYNIHVSCLVFTPDTLVPHSYRMPLSNIYQPLCTVITTLHTSPLQSFAAPGRRPGITSLLIVYVVTSHLYLARGK